MIRTLILFLWVISFLAGQAQGAIEIYVNGHKYASMQDYLASKKAAAEKPTLTTTPTALDSQQEQYIRQEAQKMGVRVDFGRIKTFQLNKKKVSDKSLHKLYVMSVEHGVVGALKDFYQARGKSGIEIGHKISTDKLQEAIAQAVTTSNDPKLLISQPGKVRIMALTADNSK